MKKIATLTALLSLTTSALVAQIAPVEGPPKFIDYQGRLLDDQGNPVAPQAQNLEIYFRIWDSATSTTPANLLWAEKQIVTVINGDFSVRLGEGSVIEHGLGDNVIQDGTNDPRPDLNTVFNKKDAFLGISVAASPTDKPNTEITPRLAFLAAPFSMVSDRSSYADTAGQVNATQGISNFADANISNRLTVATDLGIGINLPTSPLHVHSATNNGLNMSFTNNGTGSATTDGFQLGLTNNEDGRIWLHENKDLIFGTNNLERARLSAAGRLGLGTNSPKAALHLHSTNANSPNIQFTDSGSGIDPDDGFAMGGDGSGNGFLWHYENKPLYFGTNNSERMRITSSGNLGIGTTNVGHAIHAVRPDSDFARIFATGVHQGGGMFYAGQGNNHGGGFAYDGGGSAAIPGGQDRVTFFRRIDGNDIEVFSYPFNGSTVRFTGPDSAQGSYIGGVISLDNTNSNERMTLDGNTIQTWGSSTSYGDLFINRGGGDVILGSQNSVVWAQGTFLNASDRNKKFDFTPVDNQAVLDGVLKLPLSTWKYKGSQGRRHVGPMAQDFHESFDKLLNLQSNDKTIAPLDEAGVAFASIQALHEIVAEKDEKIADLESRLAGVEDLLKKLAEKPRK